MKIRIKQALIITILAIIIALGVNTVSNNRIPFFGSWPSITGSDSVVVPPSAEEGDPLFISLDEAASKFQLKRVLFIDAREPEDYNLGRIRGSINLPYDYLEDYWDDVAPSLSKEKGFVIYCSGSECESSLFLGRDMAYEGFKNIYIFYGGWREWKRAGLPIEGAE